MRHYLMVRRPGRQCGAAEAIAEAEGEDGAAVIPVHGYDDALLTAGLLIDVAVPGWYDRAEWVVVEAEDARHAAWPSED